MNAEGSIGALTELKGVGHARGARLERLGLRSIRDLLTLQPCALVCWPETCTIKDAAKRRGERVRVEGQVARSVLQRIGGKRSIVRATLRDASGEIDLVFFNQPWMKEQLKAGTDVVASGDVVDARGAVINGPKLGTADKPLPLPGTLEPVYPAGEGVSSDALGAWILEALERFECDLSESLPAEFLERVDAPDLATAARAMHIPIDLPSYEHARRRFALEPILALQARVHARRRRVRGNARAAKISGSTLAEICGRFPFELTAAQAKVASEIRVDLESTRPMRRLLQGDVGAGKTAVAALAAMIVTECGGQVAVMAPTEVLASQHAYGLRPIFEAAGLRTALLTGSLKPRERRAVTEALAKGDLDVVFGTHALFSDDVRFRRLDFVCIDEQHRFGVAQRSQLAAKGADVHVLLMTATPIPRSLALTIYGDLDVSVLDASPPGRGAIRTRWARAGDRRKMPRFILDRIAAGEQIFWVVPRIGDAQGGDRQPSDEGVDFHGATSDAGPAPGGRAGGKGKPSSAASAERRYQDLAARPGFAAAGIELVHGKLPSDERAMRLDRFRRGEIATIVATTVVEVGVDVPNATVMVIEDAHRLGLAQLHQLRGRVGRGGSDAYCFLLGDKKAEERFRLLERSRDGFELSEEDLRQRGMGDLLGLRQSGANFEGLIDPERDLDLLLAARELFQERPDLITMFDRTVQSAQHLDA